MNNEISNEDLLSNVRARLGVDKGGLKYPTYVAPPSFKPGTNDLDDKSALKRRARFIASGEMLFKTDLSTLDDTGASALYEVVTEGMFGLKDTDGQMAFGKRAKKNPRENLEMLRRFVKGEYNLIEDPEYTKWREMDEEGKFQYAHKRESLTNTAKSIAKSERGTNFLLAALAGPIIRNTATGKAVKADFVPYEEMDEERKAAYRADVIGDYEKKLSRRQTLATYLQFASNISDKAAYLLAESFQKGTPDINVEMLDPEERDKVYSAFSLMRGDQKRGRILGIETDFTDDTAANRFQMGFYGLQQSLVGLVTDTGDMVRDSALWAYAKASMDDAERKAFFEGWDATVRAERAMEQPLPEASSGWGDAFQGLMENVHWFIPYGAIGRGGKIAAGATKTVNKAKLTTETLKGMRTASEIKAAAAKTRWLTDVQNAVKVGKGAKKLNEFQSAIAFKSQVAAVEKYTKALQNVAKVEKSAKMARIGGRSLWTVGEASALSAFSSEYIAAADAAGISREESVITAFAIGLINAQVERLYVAGLESSLTPAQVKALTFKALYNAVKSDGAAGFRKWFANRVQRGVVEGAKVTVTEGMIEEPLQQLATEHGIAFDKICQELRAEGKADVADQFVAFWQSFAKQLPKDYGVFIDTVCDTMPTSLAFGVTTVGNAVRKQHLHNAWTRHQNRRAGSTHTMLGATSPEELRTAIDYDAGLVDLIQQGINTQLAVEKHWKGDKSDEAKNPHRFAEALTAARRAYRKAQTRDVVQEVAEAAGVDVKTAEVITQYLQTEAESIAFSPQARAFSSLRMSLADIDETTIKTVLPGYIEGSYAADEENGIYSGRVKLGDGTERTIAYRIGDLSEMLREQVEENSKIDSSYGVSFDERQKELGTGITWASLSDAQRYQYALTLSNGISTGRGVFELTDAKGEKVRVNADDVIYLANGRLGDIGYGTAASMGTARHETFHSLWRFARATLDEEDVQSLAKALGVDVTANGWENKLDERMAHQLEMYASGHYVSHAVSSRFDKMLDGWAGKVIKFFGSFGPADEVRDPKTGKSFALKNFYDAVLRGELGSGKLGVEIRNIPAASAVQPGATDVKAGTIPVEVTDEERAAQDAEMREEAAERGEDKGEGEERKGVSANPSVQTPNPSKTNSAENPADASVPNQRYYIIGLPNSDIKLVGRLEVRDVHTGLTTSTDEDYHDRGNQNRDDKSEESRALVNKIAAHPDPLQIGTVQPIANNGIVWALPNGDVIIGNHRVNGVRAGYEKGTADDLEKFVREDAAKRGIEIGEGVKAPLTVFILERIEAPEGVKADEHEVVRLANESQNRGFNIREQAGNDAKILIDNNLLPRMAFRPDGRIDETKSADAIGKFRQESGAQGMVGEDGMLTEEGQTRLQNAAVAALLSGTGNNALLGRIMDNAGRLDMASQLRALMKVTPELMSLAKTKPEFDIRDALAEALTLYTEWREKDEEKRSEKGKSRHDWRELDKEGKRKRGLSWEAFMSQGDMFRTPSEEAKILGDLFARAEQLRSFDREDVESAAGKKRVVDLITDYLTDYIENARNVNTETDDMFGGTPASRAEVLAAQRAKGESGARFSIAAQREYDDVVSRFTKEDGTKKSGWMKAPNGKPTKLTERQWVQVRTPSFKKWFGDWENDPANASKVVDENGEPLVVWHGSRWNPLEEAPGDAVFGKSKTPSQGTYLTDRQGFFFANEAVAEDYQGGSLGTLTAYFINARNPYVVDVREELHELDYDIETEREEAEAAGYPIGRWLGEGNVSFEANDSATAYLDDNMHEIIDRADESKSDAVLVRGVDGSFVTVVFSPSQIKSATDNTGAFDGTNADIRFSIAARLDDERKELEAKGGALVLAHHGTDSAGFTVFEKTDDKGYFFAKSRTTAGSYIREGTRADVNKKALPDYQQLLKEKEDEGWIERGYGHINPDGSISGVTGSRWGDVPYVGLDRAKQFAVGREVVEVLAFRDKMYRADEGIPYRELLEDGDSRSGVYDVALRMENPYIIDCKGASWDGIIDWEGESSRPDTTVYDRIVLEAEDGHYYLELREYGQSESNYESFATVEDAAEWAEEELGEEIARRLRLEAEKMEDGLVESIEICNGENGWVKPVEESDGWYLSPKKTRDIVAEAFDMGCDGVIFKNLIDNGGGVVEAWKDDIYVVKDSKQVKLVDEMTYADDGSIIPAEQRLNWQNEDIRFSIGGFHGALATGKVGLLREADKMEKGGASREEIWRTTGWWRGKDGKWRVELPDIKMRSKREIELAVKLHGNSISLEELVDAPELFKAYPVLAETRIILDKDYFSSWTKGSYDPASKDITLNNKGQISLADLPYADRDSYDTAQQKVSSDDFLNNFIETSNALGIKVGTFAEEREKAKAKIEEIEKRIAEKNRERLKSLDSDETRSILAHEIQHAIQRFEGFARGGSPESVVDFIKEMRRKEKVWSYKLEVEEMAKKLGTSNPYEIEKAILEMLGAKTHEQIKELEKEGWIPDKKGRDKGYNLYARGYDKEGYEDAWNEYLGKMRESGSTVWWDGSPHELYARLAGEVEARNVQKRLDMSPEERATIPPWETEDVPENRQIARFSMSAELSEAVLKKVANEKYGIGSAARNGEGFVDLERGDTFKGIEKAVREKVHEQVENIHLGITAMIGSNTNADHLVHKDSSFGDEDPEAHKYAVKNTLELFRKAKTGIVHHDKKGTKNDYIRAFTPFYFRDEVYLATITLRRDKDSDKFYSIEAVETERDATPGVPNDASKMDSGDSPRSSRRTAQEAQSPESLKTGDSPRSSRRTAQEAQSPVSLEDKISYYLGNVNETEPKFVNSSEKFSQEELLRRIRADISELQGPMYSIAPDMTGGIFPEISRMSDDELVTAAVAVRMALGETGKFSDRAVKVNTVNKLIRRLHPEYKSTDVGRESMRVISDARKFAKKIREDLDRGVSDSLILEHLPKMAREQFGREMVEEARKGQRLGRFGQKVTDKLEDRQARIVEDAVRIQTGMDVSLMENLYGINLSETLMRLAENPLTEKPPQSAGAGEGETAEAVEESAGEEAEPIDVSAAVKAAVDEIVGAAKTATDANERNRADRRAAAGRDAERSAELDGEEPGAEGGAGEGFGGEDIVAIATKKAKLDLENPRHLAEFVAELTRRYWIKEHELGQNAEVWHDLVAVQFLRKTAQGIYAKLCKDLTYSRSRETAMQRIAKFDHAATVQGLLTEMEFVGALINAQRIRDTQKALCEKLDLFLRQKFGAQGRFKPDKEEGKRNVSAEAELRARYMRHAMWLTPDAAADEARELQEKLDLLAVEFSDAGRDRDQSREFIETIRKLNVLREFGALRYKPVGEIEAAAKWWEDFERGESDDIVREMSDRDIRTKKAAELLAKAFADPKRVTAREGATTADRINKFLTGHMGFVALLNDCMRHATDADREAVKDIVGYIQREIQKAGDGTATEKRHHNDAFHAAVESIYAKSFNKVMKEMMAEDDRFLKFMGEVGGKRDIPTKGRAMQLLVSLLQEGRKVEVEDEENPGKTKFVYEGGYHDNIVRHKREGQAAELMKLMSPADMNMIKWLGMWYEQNRQDLSRVCHSLFGIGVYAELPNYFPVKMRLDKQGLEKGAAVGWTIFPKALTPRVKNERDFDTSADIFQMWSSRMEEGAQWKHHAQLGLEMRGIFGRAELQGVVISNHGEATNALMQGFITDVLAGKGAVDRSTGDVQYVSDKIRGWTALCALGGNVGVMLKQTTSIPAFGFEIGLVDTARHIVSAFTPEGLAAMGKIWQSEQRKTRWDVGNSEAVANALNKQDASWLKRAFQASMITNKLGDVVPALVVGQGVYRDCIARGMSEADAMAETWMLVERTQQSSRMENLASVQRRNRVGRIMFQFLSTQRQYLDYELRAIREVIAQPSSVSRWKKLGTTILLNHFILTSAYYWMGQLYKAMLGQEPPEDELTDWVITCLLGPYGSLFVAGFCCNYTLQRALKGYSYGGGSTMLPMESWLKNQVNDGAKLVEAIFDSEGDTWDNMLDAAGKWMSDSNSLFRDLRKIYRFRIKGEEQKKRK